MSCLGLISDTHDYLDPAVREALAGVGHILHAGDVGQPSLLRDLERIAPVTAVAGNTDGAGTWRETEIVERNGLKCLVRHIVEPDALEPALRERLARVRPQVVVFGHTHRPFCERRHGILFVNPGSASRPRGGHPPSVAVLRAEAAGPRVDFIKLLP